MTTSPFIKNSSHIWIIGYMGSGKSITAKALSERLLLPFTDSDEAIAAAAGSSISELFGRVGEEGFRDLERAFVAGLSAEPQVVACGGGLPCYNGLIRQLLETGTVVYLRATVETLTDRLRAETEKRPLLNAIRPEDLEKEISRRLDERSPVYERADLIVDVDGKSVTEIVSEIAGRIG